jgi:citrate lyase synthetase
MNNNNTISVLSEEQIRKLNWEVICQPTNSLYFINNKIPISSCSVITTYPVELKIGLTEDINIKNIAKFLEKETLREKQALENFTTKLVSSKENDIIKFISDFDNFIKINNVSNWIDLVKKGISQVLNIKVESKNEYKLPC